MSTTYYNQKWQQAISNLLQNIEEQNCPLEENKNDKGINYKRTDYEWFQYYANLYVRYLEIYRNLEDSFDQMVYPQKRKLMKQMLESVIIRMCEVKQNLIRYSTHTNIVQSDFINIDQILVDLKLTPKALSVPIPRYCTEKKLERDQIISKLVDELNITEQIQVVADTVTLDTNLETAIRIIQKLQRGRQGILRGLSYAKVRNKLKDRSADNVNEEDKRILIVQKHWRAFLARRELFKLRNQEMKFLGIEKQPISKNILEEAEKQRQRLKLLQKNNEEKYVNQIDKVRDQLHKTEQSNMKQQMLEERRKWIQKVMQMNQFANLPTKAADFIKFKNEGLPDKENIPDGKKGKDAKKDGKKDPKKQDGKGKGKKNEVEKFLQDHIAIGPTESVVKLEDNIKEYTETWGTRDSTQISQQIYDADLARDELRPELQIELEKMVDGIINLELDGMRIKYGIKKKKEKKPKKKNKKQKKVKIPQGLGKRDPQQLLEELFEKNIAKILPKSKLDDFVGNHNTLNHLIEQNSETMPDPSFSQVRNLVTQYVGIPMSSQIAKQKLQKWNWFLFYGAMGTGKTMMIRALQTETNSLIFDLTPEYVKERYTEKSELIKLLWSVIICAKEFQPSIIMIDDFDTIFSGVKTKKKDGAVSFGPKMKKVITDMKRNKLWSKTDRITVIGCTNKPYDATLKDMKKLFDKKIYFPYPNYATRKQLLEHMITQRCDKQINYFPYQTFAHVSEGFTAGSFKQTIDKVLSPKRIQRLNDEPLRVNEFVNPLSNSMCVFSEEYEKIKKFTDDVTGLKDRRQQKKEPVKDDKKVVKKTNKA